MYNEIDVAFNIMKVSPLQRWRVKELLQSVKDMNFRLYCFGSSVKGTCTPFSDLDLCIETLEYDKEYFYTLCRILRENYYDFELDNNKIDILYFNDFKPDSVFKKVVLESVVLKDFKKGSIT